MQNGVNVAVNVNNSSFYYNFAHPDMAMVKRALLTKPLKVDFLLQQEHQLPLMLEAVVTHARGRRGLWFVTNQVVTSYQDVQTLLTSLKQVRFFGIWRGFEEEVRWVDSV